MPSAANISRPWFLLSALELAALDFRVHPLVPRAKKPLLSGWTARASQDGRKIIDWWELEPDANVGIATGRGLLIIDCDGATGADSIGPLELPPTATVETANGHHYYFRGDAPTRAGVLPGVDVRGSGGQVVGPGSVHATGALYRWVRHPAEVEIAALPDDVKRIVWRAGARKSRAGASNRIYEGDRNNELVRIAGGMWRSGCSEAALLAGLATENTTRCVPPRPDEEIASMVRSIVRNWERGSSPLDKPATFAASSGNLTPAAKLVLIVLVQSADYRGRVSMGMRRIAETAGLDLGTVRDAVVRLCAEGRLRVLGTGAYGRNVYSVVGFGEPDAAVVEQRV